MKVGTALDGGGGGGGAVPSALSTDGADFDCDGPVALAMTDVARNRNNQVPFLVDIAFSPLKSGPVPGPDLRRLQNSPIHSPVIETPARFSNQ